ncbi:MAG: VWA domain-containing protein [Bacteroidales bacterium]|nr:VWA domain-containing protein [Bacteroidales bacterium]
MIRFEHPEFFYLFFAIPLLVLVFLVFRHLRQLALRRFGREEVVAQMHPAVSASRPWFKFFLFILGIAACIMAVTDPQTGSRLEEGRLEGIDIVVALDVSRSMLAQDVRPDRLERAKLAVNRLIDQLEQDRFGLVVFAGTAHLQVPLTHDFAAAKMLLRTISTNSVSVQGTSLEKAIDRSLLAFREHERHNRIIILISDGESHDDDPWAAAARAGQQGVVIHTVGIGSREGAPIPLIENNQMTGFLRDAQGNTVISRYDEATLREIAEATGGIFRHGTGPDMSLDDILEAIRTMEKEEYNTMHFADYESRYYYFAALALFLLIAEVLVSERKNKYLGKIKIFG